jgi:hypothetical protein
MWRPRPASVSSCARNPFFGTRAQGRITHVANFDFNVIP